MPGAFFCRCHRNDGCRLFSSSYLARMFFSFDCSKRCRTDAEAENIKFHSIKSPFRGNSHLPRRRTGHGHWTRPTVYHCELCSMRSKDSLKKFACAKSFPFAATALSRWIGTLRRGESKYFSVLPHWMGNWVEPDAAKSVFCGFRAFCCEIRQAFREQT